MAVVDARIERILAAAVRAPSVYNTQPWKVHIERNRMLIYADPSRQLRHADPVGREMHISCGAFLFNVRAAARRESLTAVPTILPSAEQALLIASVRFDPARAPDMDELRMSVAIDRRATSLAFDDRPLDTDVLSQLQVAARSEGGDLRRVYPSDPAQEAAFPPLRRADALVEGGVACSEGAEVHDPSSSDVQALPRHFVSSLGDAPFERRSTLAALSTPGDDPQDWITAGQALEHLLLVATTYDVYASIGTAVLENPTTRHELRRVMSLPGQPQVLMRLGYRARHRYTPRRTVDEIVTSSHRGG